MNDTALIQFKGLMAHYLKPHTRSLKELAKYQKLFKESKLPDNSAHPYSEEGWLHFPFMWRNFHIYKKPLSGSLFLVTSA